MPRQAVLLIHGVGEQKPMETLRRFVDSVWTRATEIQNPHATDRDGTKFWSKPDNISDSFELRRLTTPQNIGDISTDFFEFYWQHLMQGTTYGHVVGWARTLLLRRPGTVPRQLRPAYWTLWIGLLISAGLALRFATSIGGGATDGGVRSPWVSLVVSVLILPLVGVIVKNIVGDAARYLHAAPSNVQCRHEIRQAGITVLNALHERGYDRIILVGHSLGSVIGYDILTHGWPAFNQFPKPATPVVARLDAVEALAATDVDDVDKVQAAQRAYLKEFQESGGRWRVTDFVTLGSPLAHAAILLARDLEDLRVKQVQREVPTCLPALEHLVRARQNVSRFSFEPDRAVPAFRVPHHAAVFGLTRWTNLYFPNRAIVVGDIIGGPLAPVFGPGIRDVPVTTTEWGGLFSHTRYWRMRQAGQTSSPPHILALRHALDLTDSRRTTPSASRDAVALA
jgi:hypothetical protein